MKTVRIFTIILVSILLLFTAIPINYAQAGIDKEIEYLIQDIEEYEIDINFNEKAINRYEKIKRKIDSGRYYLIRDKKGRLKVVFKDDFVKKTDKPWEVFNKTDAAKKDTKREYGIILKDIKSLSIYVSRKKKQIASLQKELEKLLSKRSKMYQKGHGYIEVKINNMESSQPSINLLRWDWEFIFNEKNGVGVTIKQCWTRGYRGSEEKLN